MVLMLLSTALVILNALVIMALLLDVRPGRLSTGKRLLFLTGAAGIVLLQIGSVLHLDVETYARLYGLLAQLPTLVLFWAVAGRGFIKPLFVMLTTIFLSFPGMLASKLLREVVFLPPWAVLGVLLGVYGGVLWVVAKYMKPSFDYMMDAFPTADILGFSATPLLYNLMTLATGGYMPSQQNITFRILICLSTLAAYFLLMNVFRRTRAVQELRYETSMMTVQLSAARQKVEELYRTTEQAAAYRHDMRHHLTLLDSFAQQGDLAKIKGYLSRAQQELAAITPVHFCENETVDLILSSFQRKAEARGVTLSVKAALPKELRIPDTELCSVLSNGLENALHAAEKVEDATLRKILVDCRVERDMLLVEMENAYTGSLTMNRDLPTSAESGHGYGCRSMRSIAEKRNGFCTFRAEGGIFTLRLVLPMEKEAALPAGGRPAPF